MASESWLGKRGNGSGQVDRCPCRPRAETQRTQEGVSGWSTKEQSDPIWQHKPPKEMGPDPVCLEQRVQNLIIPRVEADSVAGWRPNCRSAVKVQSGERPGLMNLGLAPSNSLRGLLSLQSGLGSKQSLPPLRMGLDPHDHSQRDFTQVERGLGGQLQS